MDREEICFHAPFTSYCDSFWVLPLKMPLVFPNSSEFYKLFWSLRECLLLRRDVWVDPFKSSCLLLLLCCVLVAGLQ